MFTENIKNAGVVGAGGAGFPTHVKLSSQAECFIVNAAECEPLIETDKFIARTFANEVVEAISEISKHLGAKQTIIALKKKYISEIQALSTAIEKYNNNIELFFLNSFYPSGDEQIMVQLVTGKTVPERGIPLDVGVVVDNIGTVLNIYDALRGNPVTNKYLSVVGEVEAPIMLNVPIGTSVLSCIEKASPKINSFDIIIGGPMMGKFYSEPDDIQSLVVTKTTGNIIVLPKGHYLAKRATMSLKRIELQAKSACVQCRMCTSMCPRYLTGHKIRPNHVMRNLFREGFIDDDMEYERAFGDAANCSECGLCEMFACPMGLSPRKVNVFIKGKLREKGIQPDKNKAPKEREGGLYGQVPTERLISRLGLSKYDHLHPTQCITFEPEQVRIPFAQHIGRPAIPVKSEGENVEKGELIAGAAEGLSANIHASISGTIVSLNDKCAVISRR